MEGAAAAAPVRVTERGSGLHELAFHLDMVRVSSACWTAGWGGLNVNEKLLCVNERGNGLHEFTPGHGVHYMSRCCIMNVSALLWL